MYVLVDDVDAHHERAKAAGAVIVEELVDTPFGHRRYTCDDPQGHEMGVRDGGRGVSAEAARELS